MVGARLANGAGAKSATESKLSRRGMDFMASSHILAPGFFAEFIVRKGRLANVGRHGSFHRGSS